jgi:folate-dependent phosphoribosylglycinamide formyltransferase PurN
MLSRPSPLRVALLFSKRAPGLEHLLSDPNRGRRWDLAVALTTEEALPELRRPFAEAGIPFVAHPIRPFYRWLDEPLRDPDVRAVYDRATLDLLAPFRPDVVVLSSYLYRLTAPMLRAYPDRILNVHHADLTQRDGQGNPRYPGLRAVRDAVFAGESHTRATVHFVTEEVDRGPSLLRSWPFPVARLAADALAWGATDILKAYAFAHQEWMLRAAWGPLLSCALELVATERVAVEAGLAWVDAEPGPWHLTPRGELLPPPRRLADVLAAMEA